MNDFEYIPPKNVPVSDKDLIEDLKKVAFEKNSNVLSHSLYKEFGKFDARTISRRFGTWNKALLIAGLAPGNIRNYSDEELFENVLNIWQHKGYQPTRRDLNLPPSKISQSAYNRRFNSWTNALQQFVNYANESDSSLISIENPREGIRKSNRDPSLRLRFKVLKRDKFKCVKCGANPAKDPEVELHVDHIIPWSKDGETVLENLETLCSNCNIGKSNVH
ncbi:homing endonuclease associated repeat-containing protein [Leptospira brenneri]|uniref:homing endonuclease associated repeat-containing protein n=1 Tax=Leptospira brenneri TaxID=2023182 RepID=UPI000C2AF5A0|nr:HNH endonuclease [Leptospira brenneri]PJZ43775.1 hypothetical protein CH361_18660 [Leptospira brenneri]